MINLYHIYQLKLRETSLGVFWVKAETQPSLKILLQITHKGTSTQHIYTKRQMLSCYWVMHRKKKNECVPMIPTSFIFIMQGLVKSIQPLNYLQCWMNYNQNHCKLSSFNCQYYPELTFTCLLRTKRKKQEIPFSTRPELILKNEISNTLNWRHMVETRRNIHRQIDSGNLL